MTAARMPQRVRAGHVAWVGERLSERDWRLVELVNQLRLVTGWQLDRLCFAHLTGRSRLVTRSRALSRLVSWRVLTPLPRRVGGARRGSSVTVYALGPAGQRLLRQRATNSDKQVRVRSAGMPSERFVTHIVTVTELYVQLVEAERAGWLILRQFLTEGAARWPDGRGGWLKPDAYIVASNGKVDQLYWLECDRATESVPTIERKLSAYLDFVRRGGLGPRHAIPRVLITVPHEARRTALTQLVARIPPPADALFRITLQGDAVIWIAGELAR